MAQFTSIPNLIIVPKPTPVRITNFPRQSFTNSATLLVKSLNHFKPVSIASGIVSVKKVTIAPHTLSNAL